MNETLKISNEFRNLLKNKIEKLSLVPYIPTKGDVPTIGYGCTKWEDGSLVKLTDKPITKERAETLFNFTIQKYEKCVRDTIKIQLLQHEYDALVSIAYNAGIGAFAGSQIAKALNANNRLLAKDWFPKSFVTCAGIPNSGLVNRRNAELDMFSKCIYRGW